MWAQSGWQVSSPSEPALQPGTVIALGSVLGRAEGLGSTAFTAEQGPHRPWQLMYQLVDTLLAIRGNTRLHV